MFKGCFTDTIGMIQEYSGNSVGNALNGTVISNFSFMNLSVSMQVDEDVRTEPQVACEKCKESFPSNSILIHIGRVKEC